MRHRQGEGASMKNNIRRERKGLTLMPQSGQRFWTIGAEVGKEREPGV